MRTLRINHRTRYSYNKRVKFGTHRLMIRPRGGHDMRILDSGLEVSPQADVHWAYDTFGNSVALLSFHEAADELVIASDLLLRRYGFDEPVTRIEPHAGAYPFTYDAEESIDLAPFLPVHCRDDLPAIEKWLETVMPELPSGSLHVLNELSAAIHENLAYSRREEQGVQTPAETITAQSGTCRDFAYLFMEAARMLGFAARFVTGYLYDPGAETNGEEVLSGGGATHAWADIFIPGAGWIEFDPTNRIVAGRNLIRVASTRAPAQALPVSGTYHREEGAEFLGMEVSVSVTRSEQPDQ